MALDFSNTFASHLLQVSPGWISFEISKFRTDIDPEGPKKYFSMKNVLASGLCQRLSSKYNIYRIEQISNFLKIFSNELPERKIIL
jgi:hypothetical protein